MADRIEGVTLGDETGEYVLVKLPADRLTACDLGKWVVNSKQRQASGMRVYGCHAEHACMQRFLLSQVYLPSFRTSVVEPVNSIRSDTRDPFVGSSA
ncbi:MAG: hypothetical protein KTR32_17880 [Granulosicoccus sp.]|nr:hypothetical protein [Granulosicoccus sp.]